MTVVKHSILEDIAIIEVSNPPVNAISGEVRVGLLQAIETLSIEDKVKAIVITAPNRTFLAGADIKEFGKNIDAPILSEICDKIENSDKLVVASLDVKVNTIAAVLVVEPLDTVLDVMAIVGTVPSYVQV